MQKSVHLTLLFALFTLSACGTSPSHKNPVSNDQTSVAGKENKQTNTTESLVSSSFNAEPSQADKEVVKHSDVWKRIQSGLQLPRDTSYKKTANKIAWFARNQAYLDRVADRASPYLFHIVEELEKRDMPLEIALLPIIESAYNPFAYSRMRASGIWQFIPGTGKLYGLKQNWWYDGRRDIYAATDAALNYLQKLHKDFDGDWLLAMAAYNAGEGNVGRAIRRNKAAGKPLDFYSLRLPRETMAYVPSILAIAEIVAQPEKYKLKLKPINNQQHFEAIDIVSQIDLATAAELSELSIEELYTLNPAFNRWATDPKGPHRLLIPVDKAASFEEKLAALKTEDRIKWQQHKIKKGESLGLIAGRYQTDVATLKQINRLRGNTIRAGHSLLIPTAKKPLKHYSLSLDSRRFKGLKRSGDGKRYTYKIKRGDNLWDIGRHYGISVKQLCAWNNISSKTILRPGKTLEIWVDEPEKNAKTIPVAVKETSASEHIKYTVLSGDSLWSIAQRFGVSINQIKKWNSLAKARYIKPGQKLDIYVGTPPKDA